MFCGIADARFWRLRRSALAARECADARPAAAGAWIALARRVCWHRGSRRAAAGAAHADAERSGARPCAAGAVPVRQLPCHSRRAVRARHGRARRSNAFGRPQLHRRPPAQPARHAGALDRRAAGRWCPAPPCPAWASRPPMRATWRPTCSRSNERRAACCSPPARAGGRDASLTRELGAVRRRRALIFAGVMAAAGAGPCAARGGSVRPRAVGRWAAACVFPGAVLAALFACSVPHKPAVASRAAEGRADRRRHRRTCGGGRCATATRPPAPRS